MSTETSKFDKIKLSDSLRKKWQILHIWCCVHCEYCLDIAKQMSFRGDQGRQSQEKCKSTRWRIRWEQCEYMSTFVSALCTFVSVYANCAHIVQRLSTVSSLHLIPLETVACWSSFHIQVHSSTTLSLEERKFFILFGNIIWKFCILESNMFRRTLSVHFLII